MAKDKKTGPVHWPSQLRILKGHMQYSTSSWRTLLSQLFLGNVHASLTRKVHLIRLRLVFALISAF